VGGAIDGYWAIGSWTSATRPITTVTMETTAAKIGRSMKKCPKRIVDPSVRRCAGFRQVGWNVDLDRGRDDLAARPRAHQPVHDHLVVFGQSFRHHAQLADARSDFDLLRLHDAVFLDGHDKAARLVEHHRF